MPPVETTVFGTKIFVKAFFCFVKFFLADGDRLLDVARGHWGIENRSLLLHQSARKPIVYSLSPHHLARKRA